MTLPPIAVESIISLVTTQKEVLQGWQEIILPGIHANTVIQRAVR